MAEAIHHSPSTVLVSIKAKTRGELSLVMLKVNAQMSARVLYQDISYVEENGQKYWVAWYYREIKLPMDTMVINGVII